MDSLKDILNQKADEIDIETKRSDLELAQEELDRHFKGRAKAEKITEKGTLIVRVKSSVVASDLRFSQIQIIETVNKLSKQEVKAIRSRM